MHDLESITLAPRHTPRGACELIVDAQHFDRIVRRGMLEARASLDIATADLKAMLVPETGTRNAPSIIEHFTRLAAKGVEVRVLHAGVPSGPALTQLKRAGRRAGSSPGPASRAVPGPGRLGTNRARGRTGSPSNLTLRRCPRLHAKTVIVDGQSMYLGSANLTGAGLGAKGDTRRNFEWGLRTESSELIDAVSQQFNALWEGTRCKGCGRRDVCPVPLEEPRL